MIVELDELDAYYRYIKAINRSRIEDIKWTRAGRPIEVTEDQHREFKFIGLNNDNFPWVCDIEGQVKNESGNTELSNNSDVDTNPARDID